MSDDTSTSQAIPFKPGDKLQLLDGPTMLYIGPDDDHKGNHEVGHWTHCSMVGHRFNVMSMSTQMLGFCRPVFDPEDPRSDRMAGTPEAVERFG